MVHSAVCTIMHYHAHTYKHKDWMAMHRNAMIKLMNNCRIGCIHDRRYLLSNLMYELFIKADIVSKSANIRELQNIFAAANIRCAAIETKYGPQ